MSRKQAYERRYCKNAADVLSSLAKVAAAGRSRNAARIEAERIRHYQLMASLPQ